MAQIGWGSIEEIVKQRTSIVLAATFDLSFCHFDSCDTKKEGTTKNSLRQGRLAESKV